MEIEVGEYVRTKYGYIAKLMKKDKECWEFDNIIIDSDDKMLLFCSEDNWYGYDQRKDIKKHSKNLIDLIEVGDYVNGKKIERINDYGDFKRADFNLDYDDCDAVYNEDIKTITTKEQFSNVEYKVGE